MAIDTLSSEPQPEAFVRPRFDVSKPTTAQEGYLQTLPDLIEFNATYNRDHLFCAQYAHDLSAAPRFITHGELHQGVLRASAWLALQGLAQRPRTVDGALRKSQPVALLMASDVAWFVLFAALLRAGVPVLCMSARLAPQAVVHLVRKTDAAAVVVSPRLDALVEESRGLFREGGEVAEPAFHTVPPYAEFFNPDSKLDPASVPPPPRHTDHTDRNVVILHSSGTTGLPKPIFHSHAYLLGYCACHELTPAQVDGALNVSTLPLFHGFGLLAPCLALSIGLPFALPASTTIPTGTSTHAILQSSGATSLMTVPSILEELHQLPSEAGITVLQNLSFVAVGGAPMKHTVASALAAAHVPLLNHWGVTELGAIAPIAVPGPAHDWRWLRVRTDLALRLEPLAGGTVRLVGRAPLAAEEFAVQDLLECNPHNAREVRIAGRADDLVVLATGEKVRPHALETRAAEHPAVRAALAVGTDRAQLALLLEPAPHVRLDAGDAGAVGAYLDGVWPAVAAANAETDAHARVAREMLLVVDREKPLLRTPKGSVPRAPNEERFRAELDALYARADRAGVAPLPLGDPTALKEVVRGAVRALYKTAREIGDSEDFFERGMDSLQATMLRRRLNAALMVALERAGQEPKGLPLDVVYANPSVDRLCSALFAHGSNHNKPVDRIAYMESVADEFVQKVSGLRRTSVPAPPPAEEHGAVVLLTGSTGSLGSALLHELASSPAVAKVYALNRAGSRPLGERQEVGLRRLGAEMGGLWAKVELLEGELGAPRFGLSDEEYGGLRSVTHIVHNAWPMDFNRTLASFRPHLDAAAHIVQLALDSTARAPVRVLFASSIAVVGRHACTRASPPSPIPEAPVYAPAVDAFGYAEAKWVCERMFARAGEVFDDRLAASSVRLGQMSGAEATGHWNPAEHIPMLAKSCVAVGAVPDIEGDASWLPVNRAARVLSELLFAGAPPGTLHVENPARQPWPALLDALAGALGLPAERLPYADWLRRVREHGDARANPCAKIVPFLNDEFVRMAAGQVVLDTSGARALSRTLDESAAVGEELVKAYVEGWKRENFL
ncbi:acetyl-CoA synthetase-like protein [Phanerochaete sordida]|uniref:Acetyl-CoA synthetase-like protein n=1 Tax=Phanerochaete sordida TaxID=48140 RepID=A0A9P3GR09_9APHY|nr:acetyl-CoA synthetase-like protein [Phanerochaete sordida]